MIPELERRIRERASACGLELPDEALAVLGRHARAVMSAGRELHLTSIGEPGEFIDRHLGESLEGAAMLAPDAAGTLLDLGSGNGYPGLPICVARPGLEPLLAESSNRRAAFLEGVVREAFPAGEVLNAHVGRPADLGERPPFRVIVTRAVGGWEKVVPRLESCLTADGDLLVWAGEEMERIARRSAWSELRLMARRALPGRDRSWIWRFASRS